MSTIMGIFVQSTFVLATFVHIRNICYLPNFDRTLKVGSWDQVYKMPTVMVTYATYALATFVYVRYILAIFVHISNISTVTVFFGDQNILWPNFFRPTFFSDPAQNCFWPKFVFGSKSFSNSFSGQNNFLNTNFFFKHYSWTQN